MTAANPLTVLRERTRRSLEALIRRAETLGMVIVLENTIFPTDTPAELLGYLKPVRCDAFGIASTRGMPT